MKFHPCMSAPASHPAIPNRLNAFIVSVQVLAIAGCIYGVSRTESGWMVALLAVIFGIVMNSVYSIIHEAEHGMLFSNRRWNDGTGIVMALFFPAPSSGREGECAEMHPPSGLAARDSARAAV